MGFTKDAADMQWEHLLVTDLLGKEKEGKQSETRTNFERDFDRVIFSHPFRRLQDKTQVVPLPEEDFVHTRLTHSLEVSSVARSLGRMVGDEIFKRYPSLKESGFTPHDFGAITAAAALAHDIGNPPFGHSGEEAISTFFRRNAVAQQAKSQLSEAEWADLTNFEGNAEGFRILNNPRYSGLQLTYTTLAAFTKYPRASVIQGKEKQRKSHKKYGFFQSEAALFEKIAQRLQLIPTGEKEDRAWCRHPLAFLVEAADDICYQIIDLEDAVRMGIVSYEVALEHLSAILGERFQPEKLEKVSDPNERIGYLRAIVINTLVVQCVEVFLEHEEGIRAGTFDQALTKFIKAGEALKAIEVLSIKEIYQSTAVLETEMAGYEVIDGLMEMMVGACIRIRNGEGLKQDKTLLKLMPQYFEGELDSWSLYETLLQCADYMAGMTDSFAIRFYRKLKGISLPRKGSA